jgi:hypothetical protein
MIGTSKLEYPVELGSTVGGRIVGEVHVDYLLPTYQKNDFDRTDPSWTETVEALRGIGPMLPKDRKAMGYQDANTSPFGLLANAYRRVDPGTKCLYVDKSIARTLLEGFRRGDPEFLGDDKWWRAAQEADRLNATKGAANAPVVDEGPTPSDDPDEYGPTQPSSPTPTQTAPTVPPTHIPVTSNLDSLILKSKQIVSWSGSYSYGTNWPYQVKVWELGSDQILSVGESVPCVFFQDATDCDFVYNPRHPFLAQFPVEPRQLLGLYLAEKFKARDNIKDIGEVYTALIQGKMQDVRVDRSTLQEKATGVFERLREKLVVKLDGKKIPVLACIHESIGEVEETVSAMLSNGPLVLMFQNKEEEGFDALGHVPFRTLLRLVDRFPEDVFDGKVFAAPFTSLTLSDPQATDRKRGESKDRVMSFLKDVLWVLGQTGVVSATRGKDELARCSHSINFLAQEIVD